MNEAELREPVDWNEVANARAREALAHVAALEAHMNKPMNAHPITSSATVIGWSDTREGREYYCSCACGWIDTGWQSEEVARRSLNNHLSTRHSVAREDARIHTATCIRKRPDAT